MAERVRYVVMKAADIPEGARRAPYPDLFTVAALQPAADDLNAGARDCWAWRYSGKHCEGLAIVDLDSIEQAASSAVVAPSIPKPARIADRNAAGRVAAIEGSARAADERKVTAWGGRDALPLCRAAWSAEVKAKLAAKAEAKRAEIVCQPNFVDDESVIGAEVRSGDSLAISSSEYAELLGERWR